MPDESVDTYIRQLESEKKLIEERIAELRGEVRAINKLIYRHKSRLSAAGANVKINEKNSGRLFYEALIIDTINGAKNGLRTGEIHKALQKADYDLNYNTLRSYVINMRDKKLIKRRAPLQYEWVAVEK